MGNGRDDECALAPISNPHLPFWSNEANHHFENGEQLGGSW